MRDLEKQPLQDDRGGVPSDGEQPVITDLPRPEKEERLDGRWPGSLWRFLVPGGVVLLVLVILFAGVLAARHQTLVSRNGSQSASQATPQPMQSVSPPLSLSPSSSSTLPLPSATPLPGTGATGHGLSVSLVDGVAYVGTVNNTVYALRMSDGTKLWQQHVDGSISQQPLLINGVVYISSFVGQYGPGHVYALRSSDGSVLWHVTFDGYVSLTVPDSPGSLLYAVSPAGVAALDTGNGQARWRYVVQGANWYDIPIVHNGVVYATTSANGGSATLSALRSGDGKLLWQHKQGAYIAVSTMTTDVVYITSNEPASNGTPGSGVVTALRADDGRVVWQRAIDATLFGSVQLVNGVIYIAATKVTLPPSAQSVPSSQGITALSTFMRTVPARSAIPHKEGVSTLYALRASDGSVLWRYPLLNGKNSWARWLVVQDGVVYTGAYATTNDTNNHGEIYALRAESGAAIWRDTIQIDPGNVLLAGGVLYLATSNSPQTGALYALRAENGALLWNYPIDGNTYSAPQLVDGVLYLGADNGILYAVRARDGKLLWHYQTDVGA